ncbi:MAG: toprim domain-containing protein [Candidatus Parcubacteria bacterium]|nr:toprim domain-containing protein [Candidatus Parcubacteria bacterium]
MNQQTITIKEYLTRKGIKFYESGKELVTQCLFNDCDNDSSNTESHLYFDTETGQYDCKKCGEKGNIITLAKHLGDSINDIVLNLQKSTKFDAGLVETCHLALPANIRQYLNDRGIIDTIIDAHKLGWGKFYGKQWITIPIKDIYGVFQFFKLRQDPNVGNEKITYPKGVEAQIYDWEILPNITEKIIICEGELDRLALLSRNISAITSTHGAMTFKNEWVEKIGKNKKIYICFDNDEAGKKGAERVAKLLENTENEIYIITLPQEVGESGDITDYLIKLNGNTDDLFGKYAKEYPEKIDTSQFKPISSQELIEILGLTIKKDEENKIVTFLCELSAFTENSQFNISYNAPSSTGKSYIPTEIARLFPEEDVVEIGYCSPTAFFHDVGEQDEKRKGCIIVDLSRKILIFLDQPHTQLLERLRPLLSHDKKEISIKITDKNQKQGLRTKNVILRGYPSVIFCTAGLRIDEQEATRFLLLSPEINREKIRQGILESIKKEADAESYKKWLDENPERKLLKERIRAIKLEGIKEIKIASYQTIIDRFLSENKVLIPRNQRDIKRLVSIIKSFALINLWWREKNGTTITANEDDIEQAFKIWEVISVSQDINLPPYIYNLYQEVILKMWNDKNGNRNDDFIETKLLGLSRQELLQKHFEVYGRMLDTNQLRQQILPMLETAGLIIQEADPNDKRKILIYPTVLSARAPKLNNSETRSGVNTNEENNSELRGGVNSDLEIL